MDDSSGTSPSTVTGSFTFDGIIVGNGTDGVLNQTAGTLTSTSFVYVANMLNSYGTYTLNGSAGLVANTSGGGLIVGNAGTGWLFAFNTSSVNLGANALYIGNTYSGVGTFTIGDSAAVTTGAEYIGNAGSGVFNQTGGALNALSGTTVSTVYIGYSAGGHGTYNLTGGTGLGFNLYVGYSGTGTLNVSGGSYAGGATTSSLYVAQQAGSKGTINLAGGSLTEPQAVIGYAGAAVYNQTGGTFTSGPTYSLFTGYTATTGSATVLLSGGLMNATGNSYLGYAGTSAMTQTGGTFNTAAAVLAYQSTATSTLALSGSTSAFNSGTAFVGYSGSAVVQIAGGSFNTTEVYDGYSGTGVIQQSGGSINAGTQYIQLFGYLAGSTGTYNLSGGTFNGIAPYVGYNGTGTVNQTGGTFNTANYAVILSNASTGVGTYNLAGGVVTTAGFGRVGGTGTLNLNGGVILSTVTNGSITGLTAANVLAGGAIFNCPSGATMTVAQSLLNGTGGTVDGGLTKLGVGVLTLAATDTYTGPTNVSAGSLRANAAGAAGTGATTVASGAILGGNGSVGTVAVNSGGTITAGPDAATIGNLSTGALTLAGGSTYQVKFSATGTANDVLVLSGLTLAGATSATPVTVNLTGLGGSASPTNLANGTYVLAQDTGNAAGVFQTSIAAMTLQLTTTNVASADYGGTLKLGEVDGTGFEDLVLVAAPEPTSLLLLTAAAAPLAVGRRRRPGRAAAPR